MLKGIQPIRTIVTTLLKKTEDPYEKQQLTQVIKFINRAERSYDTYEMYKELKNSAERVIIFDRETHEATMTTNAQLFKLAVMKEDLHHEQQLHEDPDRGIGTSSLRDQAEFEKRIRDSACQRTILGEIIARRKP